MFFISSLSIVFFNFPSLPSSSLPVQSIQGIPYTTSNGELQNQANLISFVKTTDKAWYPESGATNHFAQGPPTCNVIQAYQGSGKVQLANG